jgi:hypothetical protein
MDTFDYWLSELLFELEFRLRRLRRARRYKPAPPASPSTPQPENVVDLDEFRLRKSGVATEQRSS